MTNNNPTVEIKATNELMYHQVIAKAQRDFDAAMAARFRDDALIKLACVREIFRAIGWMVTQDITLDELDCVGFEEVCDDWIQRTMRAEKII